MMPADNRYTETGQICFRGLYQMPANILANEMREYWYPSMLFGFVPVNDKEVYWYVTLDSANIESYKDLQKYVQKDSVSKNTMLRNILNDLNENQVITGPLLYKKPVKGWSSGHATLLGDAIHSTTPNLGQGAAMGIESAVVLAHHLADNLNNPFKAFKKYETTRRKKTSQITRASNLMRIAARQKNYYIRKLRDFILKSTPKIMYKYQYKMLMKII